MKNVVATAADDVWIVGDSTWHWDGKTLSQGQGPGGAGIFAISANDIWAVGSQGSSASSAHWNGAGWQQVAVPSPGRFVRLGSVTALAANDVWAVGDYDSQGLIMHWDGTGWQAMPKSCGRLFLVVGQDRGGPRDVMGVGQQGAVGGQLGEK